jgi:hypothetical protein
MSTFLFKYISTSFVTNGIQNIIILTFSNKNKKAQRKKKNFLRFPFVRNKIMDDSVWMKPQFWRKTEVFRPNHEVANIASNPCCENIINFIKILDFRGNVPCETKLLRK